LSIALTGFIYPVVVAWTWGGGWLTALGFTDFAGSGIVHLSGGVAGCMGCLVCGSRLGKFERAQVRRTRIARTKSEIATNGYQYVYNKYDNGEWQIDRVHEFVRNY